MLGVESRIKIHNRVHVWYLVQNSCCWIKMIKPKQIYFKANCYLLVKCVSCALAVVVLMVDILLRTVSSKCSVPRTWDCVSSCVAAKDRRFCLSCLAISSTYSCSTSDRFSWIRWRISIDVKYFFCYSITTGN